MRNEVLQYLDSALFADGFDDAILGFTDEGVVVYDEGRCLEILMLNGLEYDEAYEFYTFNVIGAYVGPKTSNIYYMRPIGKYIVLQPVEEEITTDSGLLLSGEDAKQLRYARGVTVAVGTEVEAIYAGEELYYDKRSAYTMMIGDKPYTIISERDVVVVLH